MCISLKQGQSATMCLKTLVQTILHYSSVIVCGLEKTWWTSQHVQNLISVCREENIQREPPKTEPDAPGTDRNENSTKLQLVILIAYVD